MRSEHSLQMLLNDFHNITHVNIAYVSLYPDHQVSDEADAAADTPNAYLSACMQSAPLQSKAAALEAEAIARLIEQHLSASSFSPFPGLITYIFPVYSHGILLGRLTFGPLRTEADPSARHKAAFCPPGANPEHMAEQYALLPAYDNAAILAARRLLSQIVIYASSIDIIALQALPLSEQIDEYIRSHYMNAITPASACEHFHISRSTLNRTLSQRYGANFLTLLHRCRIRNVCRCLDEGLSLEDAAASCGFSSPAYMSRVFRSVMGYGPRAYQRQTPDTPPDDA